MSYLHFNRIPFDGKTKKFSVHNNQNGLMIGQIRFYPQWRKYAFFPESHTFYDGGCLKEIAGFMEDLMKDRQKEKEA